MNRDDRGSLIGMVLGDGCIELKRGGRNNALRVVHSIKQLSYVEHKAVILARTLHCRMPNVRTWVDVSFGKPCEKCGFSKAHNYFNGLRTWMYPNGRKTFTRRILDMLTPEGLALWFMDDGASAANSKKEDRVTSCYTYLATNCSEAEADILVKYFADVWGLAVKPYFQHWCSEGYQYSLRMNTENSRKFKAVIAPHVIPSMQYKLRFVDDAVEFQECRATEAVERAFQTCDECGATDIKAHGLCKLCYKKQWRANRTDAQRKKDSARRIAYYHETNEKDRRRERYAETSVEDIVRTYAKSEA